MGLRRKSRELALQFLYSQDLRETSAADEAIQTRLEKFCQSFTADSDALPYAKQLIAGISLHRQEIDRQLADCSHNWRIERMGLVDRNILRIAVYEMRHIEDVPVTVAINEALEIAKSYAEPDSVGFINGILDGLKGGREKRGD